MFRPLCWAFIAFAAAFAVEMARAADGDFVWATQMGGGGNEEGFSVAVDATGNIYSAGYFTGTTNLDLLNGPVELTAAGNRDAFVAKHDASGGFLWAAQFSGVDSEEATAIAVDGNGNVLLTGFFEGTVDFDPGVGLHELSAVGSDDVFVVKLDASGNFAWARSVGGSGNERGYSIAVDDAGNPHVTGFFAGSVDFDPGVPVQTLGSLGSVDVYVLKLDVTGDFAWVAQMGGGSSERGFSVNVDGDGNVLVTGAFQSTVDFDPGPGLGELTAIGSDDIFVVKLAATGALAWARQMGGTGFEEGNSIGTDDTGQVYFTGAFQDTVNFDLIGGPTEITALGGRDVFVAKLDPAGTLGWVRQLSGSASEEGISVAVDANANVYTTGYFQGTVDFDPGVGVAELTVVNSGDVFVSKLDTAGNYIWAKRMGGSNFEQGISVAADASGNVYGMGYFQNTVDFDSDAGVAELTAIGGRDVYIVKLSGSPDATPPFVTAVTTTNYGPTNEDAISFMVEFNEDVQNFDDAADLTIGHTGTTDSGVVISGGPSSFVVNLSGIAGDGFFTVAVNTASDIQDLAGNSVVSSVTSAEVFIDNTAPGIVLSTTAGNPVGGPITVEVATSEPTLDFLDGDVDTVNATAGALSGSGDTYSFALAPTLAGVFSAEVAAGRFSDMAGNLNTASNVLARSFDAALPSVVLITPSTTGPTNADVLTFAVAFDEAVQNFNDATDLEIVHNGTAHSGVSIADGPINFVVTVTGISGDGSMTLAVSTASDVQDLVGNALATSIASADIHIDNTAPGLVLSSGAPALCNAPIQVAALLSEASTDFDSSDITSTNAVVSGFTGTGDTYVYTLEPQADGSFDALVVPGTFSDAAGNLNAASSTIARTFDGSAPVFSDITVLPMEAMEGEEVEISFTCNEALSGDAEVTVNGNPAVRIAKSAGFTFSYGVMPGDPLGPAQITISGMDLAGNFGVASDSTALIIVAAPPEVPLAAWPAVVLGLIGVLALRSWKKK